MSNTTTLFGIIALFAVGMIFSSPLTASVAAQQQPPGYLDLEKTVVKTKQDPTTESNFITDIIYKVGGFVPEDGTVAPFGYGVVTEVTNETGGTELNVIATTSHAGIEDADVQENDQDPILHNHYAVLGSNPLCGDNPAIEVLTNEEIGQVFVNGKTVIVKDLPPSSTEFEITPGTDIQFVASFLLDPVGPAVCVIPVETLNERTIIFGEKDFKPDYPRPSYDNHDEGYGNEYDEGYGNEYDEGYGNEYDYANEMSYDKTYEYDEGY